MYVATQKGDVIKIMSSVGLPANAIKSKCSEKILEDTVERPKTCSGCLKHCKRNFCVSQRLISGHSGDLENGLFFAGRDVWKIKEILSVHQVFENFKGIFNK